VIVFSISCTMISSETRPPEALTLFFQHAGTPLSVVARLHPGVVARVPKIHGRRRPVAETDGSGVGHATT
jgi:hypothetical protein